MSRLPPSEKRNRLKPITAGNLDGRVLEHLAALAPHLDEAGSTARDLRAALTPDAVCDVAIRAALARLRKRGLVYLEERPVGAFGFSKMNGGSRFRINGTGRDSVKAAAAGAHAQLVADARRLEAIGVLPPLLRGLEAPPAPMEASRAR